MSEDHSIRTKVPLTLVWAGIFLLLGVILLIIFIPDLQQTMTESINSAVPLQLEIPAPDIQLTDLNGAPVSIHDHRGTIILVNNWATWCPPCKAEIPALETYYQAHVHQGFMIIGIESGDAAEVVSAFIEEKGITFPIWLDPNGTALNDFQNWNLPSSYVIDRDGIIRLSWSGAVSLATLEEYLTPLLEE